MRILIAGEYVYEMYEKAIESAFKNLGHEVIPFKWFPYFQIQTNNKLEVFYKKAQNKYLFGPIINRLNKDLLDLVEKTKPDVVFLFRGTHLRDSTVKKIKAISPNSLLVIYNHDDPFSPDYPWWGPWRHFLASIPLSDLVLAHRHRNFIEFEKRKSGKIKLLRTWFMPDRNHPVKFTDLERSIYECDVVFAGHYEEDGRLKYLEEVAQNGWNLKIYGANLEWAPALSNSNQLKKLLPTKHAWGDEYNKALVGGKIALCFLSKLNRDTYATRCFEIPASGTMLLSEYTDDLASLFKEGEHVEFFRSPKEMNDKINYYLNNDIERKQLADRGRAWVNDQGHDVLSRMRNVITWIEECRLELGK